MRNISIWVVLVLLHTSLVAVADCVKEGHNYKTGERVGPFVCTADGTWKR